MGEWGVCIAGSFWKLTVTVAVLVYVRGGSVVCTPYLWYVMFGVRRMYV
jgi:hypothetical protein